MNEETIKPSEKSVSKAAEILQRPRSYCDGKGYQTDLLGAAIHPHRNRVAYVESRMKKRWWSPMWRVSIRVHLWIATGKDRSIDIKCYNPFFGCDIEHFGWMDDKVLLVYSEKHTTYTCTFGTTWPPYFVHLEP